MGYTIDDGSFLDNRIMYQFNVGDKLSNYARHYILGEGYDPGTYSVDKRKAFGSVTVEQEPLQVLHSPYGVENGCLRYIVTDIYQNNHYTQWMRY